MKNITLMWEFLSTHFSMSKTNSWHLILEVKKNISLSFSVCSLTRERSFLFHDDFTKNIMTLNPFFCDYLGTIFFQRLMFKAENTHFGYKTSTLRNILQIKVVLFLQEKWSFYSNFVERKSFFSILITYVCEILSCGL